jgi:hypothetical protein
MHVRELSERAARASSEVIPNADVRLMVVQVKGIVGVLSPKQLPAAEGLHSPYYLQMANQ